MNTPQYYASLSPCKKRKVGCVVEKNREVIAYGFNHGWHEKCSCKMDRKNPDCLHAEEMALSGEDKDMYCGATLRVTHPPCDKCLKLIRKHKIKEVIIHV